MRRRMALESPARLVLITLTYVHLVIASPSAGAGPVVAPVSVPVDDPKPLTLNPKPFTL